MSSEEEDERDALFPGEDRDLVSPTRKRARPFHRRNLRAVKKGLGVESFNVSTLTTHTEELKRIERLGSQGGDTTTGSSDVRVGTSAAQPQQNGDQDGVIVLSDTDDDNDNKPHFSSHRSACAKYSDTLVCTDGSLVVNLGHPSNEQDIHLAPQIAVAVKPHQVQRGGMLCVVYLFMHRWEASDSYMTMLLRVCPDTMRVKDLGAFLPTPWVWEKHYK